MQVEGGGNHRGESNDRSHPPACVNSAEAERIEFQGYLKGKSALMNIARYTNLKYKYGNLHFWSRGYYVSAVGLNEATIAKYVSEQDKRDQMVDLITTK